MNKGRAQFQSVMQRAAARVAALRINRIKFLLAGFQMSCPRTEMHAPETAAFALNANAAIMAQLSAACYSSA